MNFYSNAWAEVNLTTLKENYEKIKKYAGDSQIISVVKANAYGHGVKECSRVFYEGGCRFFAVANVGEALKVRALYSDCEILVLGICPLEFADILASNDIIVALGSLEYAKALSKSLGEGKTLRAHLKLDTGMNRIGFSAHEEDFDDILSAFALENIKIEGMFTHFACADMPKSTMTDVQLARYNEIDRKLKENGIELKCRHTSNSAATVFRPDTHRDYVRCGIILYGLDPSDETPVDDLVPVMSLKSQVTHVHTLRKGESVGYGATYTAEKDMRIATVPIGYADGFVRAYANGGYVKIKGQKCPIVGRICMDQCSVAIGDLDVKMGDEVVIFDENDTVDNFARAAHTINYECTCILSERVQRVYKK